MAIAMEWRGCVGFPDYEISEFGDVRRTTSCRTRTAGQRLRGYIDTDGYLAYALCDAEGRKTHRCAHQLVADAYIGISPAPNMEVAHENGSRLANHHTNLRWATRKGNDADREIHGTASKGEANGRATITEADVHFIRREYREIKRNRGTRKVVELEQRYGLHRGTIISIARGKSWSHVPFQREA